MTSDSGVDPRRMWPAVVAQAKDAGKTADMAGVIALFRERVTMANVPMNDRKAIGAVIHSLAAVQQEQGDLKAALLGYEEATRYFRDAGEKALLQEALGAQAEALVSLGDYQRAMPLVTERTALCRELNNQEALLNCLAMQGKLQHWAGNTKASAVLGEEQQKVARDLGDDAVALALTNKALLHIGRNELDAAEPLLNQADEILRHSLNREQLANVIGTRAVVLMQRGKLAESLALQREAAQLCRQMSDNLGLVKALTMQGYVLQQQGRRDEALVAAREADELARKIGQKAIVDQMIAPLLAELTAPAKNTATARNVPWYKRLFSRA